MPPPPANDPAARCLDQVAAIASARLRQAISRVAPRDAALTWKAAAVHPLQTLETEYQGIVRDAVRGIDNVDRRKQIEGKALGEFFFFDAGTPRLLGVGQGEPYGGELFPFLEDKLREARNQLKAATLALQPPPGARVDGAALRKHLKAAYDATRAVREAFLTLPGSRQWPVPPIVAAGAALTGIADAIRTTTSPDGFALIIQHLKQAGASLDEAVAGLGTVQMFYVIESFYLFRLLIRYRIEAPRGLTDDAIAEASGALTDIVANGHDWLANWLRDKIVDLAARIALVDPSGNTLFFLKGGRALRYLEGAPQRGKNDWDTQIVINPELPPAAWYELFLRVSNAVLLALKDYKAELYMLLHHYAARFAEELSALPAPMAVDPPGPSQLFDVVLDRMEEDELADRMEVDEPPDDIPDRSKANCKAELIDIGLPRYDSVEAREQWTRLRQDILVAPDGIPYPGYYYYVAEYLLMIREVFAGTSPALRKAPARIERLYGILQLPGVAPLIEQLGHGPAEHMPQSFTLVGQVGDLPARYALIALLADFVEAYGLDKDPGFAATLDSAFAESLPRAAQLAPYSPALREAIAGAANWTPGFGTLADAIGFCQWFSQGVEAHLEARGTFVLGQLGIFNSFLRFFFANGPFRPDDELEVQAAVRGSYGAWQQADYVMSTRIGDLDPPTYLSIGLYSARDNADPATILELVSPIIAECLQPNADRFNVIQDPDANAILIYWAEPQPIEPFMKEPLAYAPLAIEISVIPPPARPLLSYVWGLGTLSLRDLVREYRRDAARIEEYGRRSRLRRTADTLVEIMTRAANPEPRNPALAAMRRGIGHHLMISSASLAVGPGGAYPASYYPDMAFEVLLTDNRPALRAALTLPAMPDPPADRSLDLLVINQGHGGIGAFDHWSADDLRTYLVEPLRASGVRASIIVLDFCLSASLIDAFAPLCAPGGVIVSNVYSIAEVIMTTEVWSAIQPALAARNLGAVQAAINARAQAVSAGVTGLAHLQDVRTWTEPQTAQYLQAFPADFDAISITRYLPAIATALQDPAATLAQVFANLAAVRAMPNLGLNERVVLVGLPAQAAGMTLAILAAIQTQLQNRLHAILTQPQYGLQRNVDGLPLFGPHSLWELVRHHRMQLLALAAGLERCPTPFTLFDADTQELNLDANLAGAIIAPPIAALLQQIEPNAPVEVQQIIALLFQQQAVTNLNGINNYLQ